ncbi:MAG: hypothetical protein HKL90_05025 [Elusimicrobia bacterium]|nr:hypothetical protein [Elusimicrobiota bacterium]
MRKAPAAAAVLGLALAAAGPARAISSGAGTSGANFLEIGQGSARAMALSGAYVALAEGSDALTWNPAGLAATQQREFAFSYLSYVQGLQSPVYMAYAQPMGRTAWGVNAGYMSEGGFDVRDQNGIPQQNTSALVRDGYATFGVARSFFYEKLYLGASLRGIHQEIVGAAYNTVSADAGAILHATNALTFGLALQNFGPPTSDVAHTVRGGAALRHNDFFTTTMELRNASDTGTQFAIGEEFSLPEEYLDVGQLSLRVGYQTVDSYGQSFNSTLKTLYLDQTSGVSFGFGLYTSEAFGYGLSLDYAFVPYGALGTVDQLSFKLKF